MATKKKEVKVRDMKPLKDAKGGAARQSLAGSTNRNATNRATTNRNVAGRTVQ